MDFDRARAFIDAIPTGRWAAYKDVATAAGNERGAQAIGTWLRRDGHEIDLDYRVLTVDGWMPDAFRSAGEGPVDAAGARAKLKSEGVVIANPPARRSTSDSPHRTGPLEGAGETRHGDARSSPVGGRGGDVTHGDTLAP